MPTKKDSPLPAVFDQIVARLREMGFKDASFVEVREQPKGDPARANARPQQNPKRLMH